MSRVPAPFGRRAAAVTARERHGPYVVLHCEDPHGPRPRPGQFYMLSAADRWGGGESERPFLPRALSVLRASPDGHELHFLIEDVGPGTNRLCELDRGEDLLLVGPLGAGFTPPREGRTPLLVGGGVGIAPLAIWQDELPPPCTVLLGFSDAEHADGRHLLRDANIATDDGSLGHHGFVTDLLPLEFAGNRDVEVFACGPPPMLEAVRIICEAFKVPAQLALESGMACGFGACFGCVVPTRDGYVRLCVEGPVLDAATLETALVAGAGHL